MKPVATPGSVQLIEKKETRTSRGILSKGWYQVDGRLMMVKGNSITESGIAGLEPYSEVMASAIAEVLGMEHVTYTLMPAQLFPEIQTKGCQVVSVCENFVQPGEILYHFADMADAHFLREGKRQTPEALFQYARELYGSKWLYQMLIFDALIGNEDRHENNFDVLLREGTPVPPPLYDNGASLLAWVSESEMTEQALRYEFDRSKPFRSRHEKQVRLVDQPVFPKQEPDAVLRTILKAIEPTLGLLSEKRAQAIRMYLRYRMPYLEKAMG